MPPPTQPVAVAGETAPAEQETIDKGTIMERMRKIAKALICLACYIFLTGADPAISRWRMYNPDPETSGKEVMAPNAILWWQKIFTTIIFVTLNGCICGVDGLKTAFGWSNIKLFAPQSLFFATSKIPKVFCGYYLPGDVERVIASGETVAIAVMFTVAGKFGFHGHHYSSIQWALLAVITFSVVTYGFVSQTESSMFKLEQMQSALEDGQTYKEYMDGLKGGKDKDTNWLIGICCSMGHMICLVFGTYYGEVAFKGASGGGLTAKKLPFVIQKNTDAIICLVWYTFLGTALFPWVPDSWGKLKDRTFVDFDIFIGMGEISTYCYIAILISKGVSSNLIVKHLDSMAKQVGKNVATLLTFWWCIWWGNMGIMKKANPPTWLSVVAVTGVAVCCFSYGTATVYSKGKQKWRKLYNELADMNRELDVEHSIQDAKAAAQQAAGAPDEKEGLLRKSGRSAKDQLPH